MKTAIVAPLRASVAPLQLFFLKTLDSADTIQKGMSVGGAIIVVLLMLWPITSAQSADEEVSEMTLPEILELVERLPSTGKVSTVTQLTQRLIDLAFFEYGVSAQEREGAEKMAATLISAIERSLRDRPEELAVFQEAYEFQLSHVPIFGVGSLSWEIKSLVSRPKT